MAEWLNDDEKLVFLFLFFILVAEWLNNDEELVRTRNKRKQKN